MIFNKIGLTKIAGQIKLVCTLLLSFSALFTTQSNAFVLSSGDPWAEPEATYHTSPVSTTGSDGLTSNQLRDAFIEALAEWTNRTAFNYIETSGSANPCVVPGSFNPDNNDNGYTFGSTSCSGGFGGTTLAITTTWRIDTTGDGNGDGEIIQSGIVFNSASSWNIYNGSGSGFDFRRVAVHELGHSLGLAHTSADPAIMRGSIGSIEVPQTDDLNGIAAMYGAFDSDGDGVTNDVDNCPNDSNANQADFNNDGEGDVCDNSDGDSILDDVDNCRLVSNQSQADFNNDGEGDACDNSDGDTILDNVDNCPLVSNQNQLETGSANGVGDACDPDDDGVRDDVDNCPNDNNPSQADFNNDDEGDACDNSDGDSLLDDVDNCPLVNNQNQADFNNDGEGDVCDNSDGDTILDDTDNCPLVSNQNQADINNDNEGDACDNSDGDNVLDDVDNCPFDNNQNQNDLDQDGEGDVCDNDADGDGAFFGAADSDDMNRFVCSDIDGDSFENGECDDCSSGTFNPANDGPDADNDGLCNAFETDDDNDGIDDDVDNCPVNPNPGQEDNDMNGIGNVCDGFCVPIKTTQNTIALICL